MGDLNTRTTIISNNKQRINNVFNNLATSEINSSCKYIYFTLKGQEQLFDLKNDPYELNDLTLSLDKNSKLMKRWRTKMVNHLKERGEAWVKDDKLVVQKTSIQRGINFPK